MALPTCLHGNWLHSPAEKFSAIHLHFVNRGPAFNRCSFFGVPKPKQPGMGLSPNWRTTWEQVRDPLGGSAVLLCPSLGKILLGNQNICSSIIVMARLRSVPALRSLCAILLANLLL